jgi:hypothetical protein
LQRSARCPVRPYLANSYTTILNSLRETPHNSGRI